MDFKDLYAVIVVYNIAVEKSLTYKCICDSGVNIIVCDNSTRDCKNGDFCKGKPNIEYINMGGNVGLPKAYNAAIEKISGKDAIVCIFDDDTEIPADYFAKVLKAQKNREYNIFVPMVYDEVGLLSPSIMKKNFMHRADNLQQIGENIAAINSAMAVRTSIYDSFRYDENMFLDFVDFAFIREMRSRGEKLFVMEDVIIHQTFSANVDSRESAQIRFKILKKDLKYYYKDAKLYYFYVITKRKLRLCLKFKTLYFLFK